MACCATRQAASVDAPRRHPVLTRYAIRVAGSGEPVFAYWARGRVTWWGCCDLVGRVQVLQVVGVNPDCLTTRLVRRMCVALVVHEVTAVPMTCSGNRPDNRRSSSGRSGRSRRSRGRRVRGGRRHRRGGGVDAGSLGDGPAAVCAGMHKLTDRLPVAGIRIAMMRRCWFNIQQRRIASNGDQTEREHQHSHSQQQVTTNRPSVAPPVLC